MVMVLSSSGLEIVFIRVEFWFGKNPLQGIDLLAPRGPSLLQREVCNELGWNVANCLIPLHVLGRDHASEGIADGLDFNLSIDEPTLNSHPILNILQELCVIEHSVILQELCIIEHSVGGVGSLAGHYCCVVRCPLWFQFRLITIAGTCLGQLCSTKIGRGCCCCCCCCNSLLRSWGGFFQERDYVQRRSQLTGRGHDEERKGGPENHEGAKFQQGWFRTGSFPSLAVVQ
mmetsp:Transcript_4081/g.11122  ORF Transcript_4081/g.11122 Transcript_4081/m.11122 type:complete len:230 (-) Transcript_4081:486-1175(-)